MNMSMITAKKCRLLILFLFYAILATVALSLFSWKYFTYSEPPVVVLGDKNLLSKIHINVYMGRRDGRSSWRTIFLNGKYYQINNQGVDWYAVYVNYDGKLFFNYSYENMGKIFNDIEYSENVWQFCKINSDIVVFFSNSPVKCDEINDASGLQKLLPLEDIEKDDLSDEGGERDIKVDNDIFIRDLKKSFFEVVEPVN